MSAFSEQAALPVVADLADFDRESGNWLERAVFNHRLPVLLVFALATVVLLEMVTSQITLKSERMRGLIDGRPTIIVEKGRILSRNMAGIRYNLSDLLGKLREKGVVTLSDVDYAIVETSGELSVILNPAAQPPTRRDLGMPPAPAGIPRVVIKDGRVMERNLARAGRTRDWLLEQLQQQGLSHPGEVMLAAIESDGSLFAARIDSAAPELQGDQIE